MDSALVLSGGGAKGSFEIGALEFLYENAFFAKVICGTSVGAVNAVQLAHGGTAAAQGEAFMKLKEIWQNSLKDNDDMYLPAAWLAQLDNETRQAITDLFSVDLRDLLGTLAARTIIFPPYAIAQAMELGIDVRRIIPKLINAVQALPAASSVFTLDPIRAKVAQQIKRNDLAKSGVALRLVAVSLDSGAVRYINEKGGVFETDGRPVQGAGPNLCAAEQAAFNASLVARGVLSAAINHRDSKALATLRKADDDVASARDKRDLCLANARLDGLGNDLIVDVVDGVIASASIPCVFPPVALGDENYVDGGIRWVLPLKAALDSGVESIVAVNASPAGVPPSKLPYVGANLLRIAERSVLDLLLWEVQERQLEVGKLAGAYQGRKVWIITPRVDVHDTLTIDPGLIDINIGYGYMCAADVLQAFPFDPRIEKANVGELLAPALGPVNPAPKKPGAIAPPEPDQQPKGLFIDAPVDAVQARLADAITRCRRQCWELEHEVFIVRLGSLCAWGHIVICNN